MKGLFGDPFVLQFYGRRVVSHDRKKAEAYDETILFREQEKWLSSMLEAGMKDGRFKKATVDQI